MGYKIAFFSGRVRKTLVPARLSDFAKDSFTDLSTAFVDSCTKLFGMPGDALMVQLPKSCATPLKQGIFRRTDSS